MSEQWMVFWALTAAVAVSWLVIYYLHMSLDMCLGFFRANARAVSYCRKIFLLHGSRENGNPGVFKEAVQRATGKPVIVCG